MPYILDKQGIEVEEILIHTNSAKLTDEQFFQLCSSNKEIRFERDKHKNIIIMAPSTFISSNRESKIVTKVSIWNDKTGLGEVTGPSGGYYLPDGSMFAPDVAWISKEKIAKLSAKEQEKFPYLCPDFVVEVRSKSDSLKKQKEKMEAWMSNGCRLGWLVDPYSKTTFIYKPNSKPTEHPFNETLNGENVLPGFELKLSEIIT
jgi:Uma2 family endonuclease